MLWFYSVFLWARCRPEWLVLFRLRGFYCWTVRVKQYIVLCQGKPDFNSYKKWCLLKGRSALLHGQYVLSASIAKPNFKMCICCTRRKAYKLILKKSLPVLAENCSSCFMLWDSCISSTKCSETVSSRLLEHRSATNNSDVWKPGTTGRLFWNELSISCLRKAVDTNKLSFISFCLSDVWWFPFCICMSAAVCCIQTWSHCLQSGLFLTSENDETGLNSSLASANVIFLQIFEPNPCPYLQWIRCSSCPLLLYCFVAVSLLDLSIHGVVCVSLLCSLVRLLTKACCSQAYGKKLHLLQTFWQSSDQNRHTHFLWYHNILCSSWFHLVLATSAVPLLSIPTSLFSQPYHIHSLSAWCQFHLLAGSLLI